MDCPGGDAVRVDDEGVSHDSYAIADHFRAYVGMPDLQYFKLYLSDKDYTVSSYGAREEVIGAFYQCGSQRGDLYPGGVRNDLAERTNYASPSYLFHRLRLWATDCST